MINKSERPIILCGHGVITSNAGARLQAFVEQIHAHWTIDKDYMAPPSQGALVALDPALLGLALGRG